MVSFSRDKAELIEHIEIRLSITAYQPRIQEPYLLSSGVSIEPLAIRISYTFPKKHYKNGITPLRYCCCSYSCWGSAV